MSLTDLRECRLSRGSQELFGSGMFGAGKCWVVLEDEECVVASELHEVELRDGVAEAEAAFAGLLGT